MPRCVVDQQAQSPRADYPGVLGQAQAAFGDKVVPLYVPAAHAGSEIDDLVALLSQTVSDYSEYATKGRQVREPTTPSASSSTDSRGTLIEGIIEESEDESLMDRYMGGEEIDFSLLVDDLETAVARASFFPVIPVCAQTGLGLEELLEIITQAFPPPSEHTFPDGLHDRSASQSTACPATRPDLCSPRSSRRRRTRTSAGSAWSASSRGRFVPTRPCMCRGTSPSSTDERARTRGPRRGRANRRSVVTARKDAAAHAARRSPATSARSPSCRGPRPATP